MQACQIKCTTAATGALVRPAGLGRVRPFAPLQQPRRNAGTKSVRQRITLTPPRAAPEEAAEQASSSAPAAAAAAQPEEVTFYEGSGSNAELAISLLLAPTLLFLPLTIASIGRRLWIKYRFTNKRLIVTTNSPILQREVQVEYSKIKEIRSAPRAFGLWGDVVVFLKDGSRLPIAGLERYQEIVDYMEGFIQ